MADKSDKALIAERVYAERVQRLYASEPIALLATFINGFILVLVLWTQIGSARLIVWLAFLYLVSGLRFIGSRKLFQKEPRARQYQKSKHAFAAGVALSGMIWGAAGIILFPAHSTAHQMFISFVVGGMVAGASVAYASFLIVFIAYSLPALFPVIVRLFMVGGDIHLAMATMLLLYLALMLALAFRIRDILTRSFELRYENRDLIGYLSEARRQTERMNKELQKHRDQLEVAVAERTADLCRTNDQLKETLVEYRWTQQSLSESEEKYRLLVERANGGIFIAQDGFIKFPNPRTLEITGYSAEQLQSIPFTELIHPDDRNRVLDYHRTRLGGGSCPENYTFKAINRGGERIWIEISSTLTSWEGKPATLNLIRDATQQKKLEKQLLHAQKMEAVGTLAGGIAHDFNNLLHVIYGYAELLLMDLESDEDKSSKIEQILQSAKRGSELARQMLTFSSTRETRPQSVDLNEALPPLRDLLERTFPKEISIQLDLPDTLPNVLVDPEQLEQLVTNLAVNARDAMPGGGELRIEAAKVILQPGCHPELSELEPGPYVRIEITDTGHGMDAAVRERIFEPFFSTKEVGKGTGLGLAMAYGIVNNHGGTMVCNSEPGTGTSFQVYFPGFDPPPVEAEPIPDEPVEHGAATILVVDDEPFIRDLGRQLFTRFGYDVLVAEDGKQALEIYEETMDQIDLVILDLIMPNMDGDECLGRLLKLNPEVKVIISTGFSPNGPSREILQQGAKGLLPKPFRIADALHIVHQVLHEETGADLPED